MAAAATAAAATAVQPAPWRPDLATAKALGLLCLASLSVGFAAVGAATVAIVACDYDEACAVHQVLAATSVRALVFAVLLAPIAPLLIVRAAVCDTGFRDELIIRSSGTCRLPECQLGVFCVKMLCGRFLRLLLSPCLASLVVRCWWCCHLQKDLEQGGFVQCSLLWEKWVPRQFLALSSSPLLELKLWRMKLGGAALADSNV
ncbi:hypothetical protein PVAP13_6NG114503 [Panicum virgatum]|uniref:Uncharacterized protein n=1 Tax=Panicum virgatum TaxID=38727 RepID=A0A8T0QZG6_PANVG|nr:hypothetical protein PVAP13_6NG114503 [Panicum virgatum]